MIQNTNGIERAIRTASFFGLESFPAELFAVAEEVRMPANHLLFEVPVNGVRVQVAFLLCDDDLESEVEEKVSEFTGEFVGRALADRIDDFMRLLQQVRDERLSRLFGVPWTVLAKELHES